MSTEAEAVVLEGLRRALMEATGNLYRVFTSMDRGKDHEQKFSYGVDKHIKDYDRMVALVGKKD